MRIHMQVALALVAAAGFVGVVHAQSTPGIGGVDASRVSIDKSVERQTQKNDFGSAVRQGVSGGADTALSAGSLAAPFIPGGAVVSAAVNGGAAAAPAGDDGAAAASTARQTPKTDFGDMLGRGVSKAGDAVVNVPPTPSTPIDVTPMPRETSPIVRPAVRPVLTTTPAFAPVPIRQPVAGPLPQPAPITQPIKVDQPVILQPQTSPILIRR